MNGIFVLKNPMSVPLRGKNYIVHGYRVIGGVRYADAEVVCGRYMQQLHNDSWELRKELGAVI